MTKMTMIRLPNGIACSQDEWTKDVELDEMTGEEEDILLDQTRAANRSDGLYARPTWRRVSEVLSRCTKRIGNLTRPEGKTKEHLPDFFEPHWRCAYSSDRIFAMIRLRQLSIGSDYIVSVMCPACKIDIKHVKFDLGKLRVTEIPLDVARRPHHEVVLPRSGHTVAWRFLVGERDEERLSDAVQNHKSEFISALTYVRIAAVNGTTIPGGLDYVKKMKTLDRRTLAKQFDKTEGGIETSLEFTCPKCSHDFVRQLNPMDGSFFFPEELPEAPAATSTSRSLSSPTPGDGPVERSSDFRLEDEASISAG